MERGGFPGLQRLKDQDQERSRSSSLQMEMRPVYHSEEKRGSFDPRITRYLQDRNKFEEARRGSGGRIRPAQLSSDARRRSFDPAIIRSYQGRENENRDKRYEHQVERVTGEEVRRGSSQRYRGRAHRIEIEKVKTNKELFDEAIEENKSLLELPIPLSQKREFLRQHGGNVLDLRENTMKKRVKAFRVTLGLVMNQLYNKIEPWTEETKYIEGSFGTGVGSYFRLLRNNTTEYFDMNFENMSIFKWE